MTGSSLGPPSAVGDLLRAAEGSFTVRDLATYGLVVVSPDSPREAALKVLSDPVLDVAPVDDPGGRHRIVRRSTLVASTDRSVDELAEAVNVREIVSDSMPLARVVERLRSDPYLLVLQGDQITAIVTASDLQRPCVTMSALAYVMAIEAGFNELIEGELGPGWLDYLDEEEQRTVSEIFQRRCRANYEISKVYCLTTDMRVKLMRGARTREVLGYSRDEFNHLGQALIGLRNPLAHGTDLLQAFGDPAAAAQEYTRLRELAQRVESRCSQRRLYWNTVVVIHLDGDDIEVRNGETAPARLRVSAGQPWYVITAWNPNGRELLRVENEQANERLSEKLRHRHWKVVDAEGVAMHEDYRDQGFAVRGPSRKQIQDLGREFGQAAVWEIGPDVMRLCWCLE